MWFVGLKTSIVSFKSKMSSDNLKFQVGVWVGVNLTDLTLTRRAAALLQPAGGHD
jgi:hypothetical protein